MIKLPLSEFLGRLRITVKEADYLLSRPVYDGVHRLFLDCESSQNQQENLQRLAPEYGRPEFLLNVDRAGSPVHVPQEIVQRFRATAGKHPSFEGWFQEKAPGADQRPGLLMARWLCHLLGLRHKVVQLFIDHPAGDSLTLVQVRSAQKVEAPGCFDAPAAGHVVGLESETGAMFMELEQELGLALDDLDEIEMVGAFHYCAPMASSPLCNVEFRVVFAGRLKPDRLQRIRFLDGEVAAISIFSLSELQALIDTFPERVASGLLGSFPTYLRSRGEH